jgi:chemotaxis protein methyltransferase CheR
MTINRQDFTYLRELVLKRAAILIDPGKEYMVETRLQPVAKAEGYASLSALVDVMRVKSPPGLEKKVIDALTTNESSFFRDLHPFETLRHVILPQLIKDRQTTRTIRIWSGACSSGQEPYSIAMLIREHFPQLASWKIQITATDISETMVSRARAGIFNQLEVNRGLPASLLIRYFTKDETVWRIKPEIGAMIEFKEMNLLPAWGPMPTFDVVFLRNVLIYFSVETKRLILGRIAQVLCSQGFLFLGGAETTIGIDDSYRRIMRGPSVYYGHPKRSPEPSLAEASNMAGNWSV